MFKEIKDSNPKDAIGSLKASASYIPRPVIYELGLAMLEGSIKYGRHNYRAIGVRASVYYDACMRHLDAYWEGEDIDTDSGLPHIVKAMACLAVLRDAQMLEKCFDDRPPRHKSGWLQHFNVAAKKMIENSESIKPPFMEIDYEKKTKKCAGGIREANYELRTHQDCSE